MNSTSTEKNIYVVLGMARSGTSAITRGLKALGVDLGSQLTPGDQKNVTGFWEDSDIVFGVNRALLLKLEKEGHQQLSQPDALQDYYEAATNLLKKRMANTLHWGFKDPRTAKLLPFWQKVFTDLHLKHKYVIALRHPLASAHSASLYTGVDLEGALLMWLTHLIAAVDGTLGKSCVVVNFENMLNNPQHELKRMHAALALPFAMDQKEIDFYANQFLDKKLRHHRFDSADVKTNQAMAVVPLCEDIYRLLAKVANDVVIFNSEAFLIEWRNIKQAFNQIYPIYAYLDEMFKRNKQLERDLRSIHRSLPWKLMYPLRLIDSVLRSHRHQRRERRRLSLPK